jgi:hypothetical protein
VGGDEAGIADDGLQDDGSTFVLLQQRFYTFKVVVLRDERALGGARRDTRGIR